MLSARGSHASVIKLPFMKIVAVIPARLASTRLPRKMLREIQRKAAGRLGLQAVRSSALLDDVIIATDSEEILAACEKHACNARMTSDKHRSGTERVHEVSQSIPADVYINVQGDEPMIRAAHIDSLSHADEKSRHSGRNSENASLG